MKRFISAEALVFCLIAALMFLVALCTPQDAEASQLLTTPNATSAARLVIENDDLATTTLHVLNTTGEPLPLPRPCEMVTCTNPQLEPHGFRIYPTSGSGPLANAFDPRLTVQSELVTPYGARLRVDGITPVDEAWFIDLIPPGTPGANSGIVVFAVDRDAVVSLNGGPQVQVGVGRAVVLSNDAAVVHLVTTVGSGKVIAFGYGNVWINGSLFGIPAR